MWRPTKENIEKEKERIRKEEAMTDKLKEELNIFFSDDNNFDERIFIRERGWRRLVKSPLNDELEHLCRKVLISDFMGITNYTNVKRLNKYGYDVYAGERDLLGWLYGYIEKDNKVIVYGDDRDKERT